SARMLKFSQYKYIVEYVFNTLRNDVAGARNYRNLPPAARMSRMFWNKELAYFARLDVSRCTTEPRPSMCSTKFSRIGSVADIIEFKDHNLSSIPYNVRVIAEKWAGNAESVSRSDTLYLDVDSKTERLLTTTMLMNEHNTHFGCSALIFKKQTQFYLAVACAFNTDNKKGERIYQWGLKPGIKCRKRDSKYRNLCAAGERYRTDEVSLPLYS
ncbi:hypothetical protein KR222_005145, partial [Zaprionus bogoriensis]